MAITNPEAIRFSNEVVRPMAERMRDLIIDLEAIGPEVDRLLPSIPNDPTEIVEDGREAEGVSRLNGAQINALAQVRAAVLALADAQTRSLISSACVRPPIR